MTYSHAAMTDTTNPEHHVPGRHAWTYPTDTAPEVGLTEPVADLGEGVHAATYHGIASAECLLCGYVERERTALEMWNDLAPWCPMCATEPPVRWTMVDGTTDTTRPDADR